MDTEYKLAEINKTEMREVFRQSDLIMFYTVVCEYLDIGDFDYDDDIGGNRSSDDDEE